MSAFPGVSSYQSSSLGSKFVVIGVVCCQEMRRNALFHKVLPVLTKYLSLKTPVIDSMITIASVLLQKDYFTEGYTLEYLGIAHLDREALLKYLHEGVI